MALETPSPPSPLNGKSHEKNDHFFWTTSLFRTNKNAHEHFWRKVVDERLCPKDIQFSLFLPQNVVVINWFCCTWTKKFSFKLINQ